MGNIKNSIMPVKGLSCSNCDLAIERGVSKLPGIQEALPDHTDVVPLEKKILAENMVIANQSLKEEIIQRKLTEKALQESEKEFRSLAESMPHIVWITRADGWNTYFNQQWVEYTGLTLEESCGHGWNQPFHPDDRQHAWEEWQNAINNNGIYSWEARLRRFDGEYRWWLVRGVPQLSESGEILKWFGTCTDIEEIKKTQKTLQESEVKFRAMAEFSPMAIYSSSGPEQKVEYINPAFYKMFGFEYKDVPTLRHWWIKAFPDEKYRLQVMEQWQNNIETANKNNTNVEVLDCVCNCKDGSQKNISWESSNIGDQIWAFGLDLTERKRAENELFESERFLRESQAIARLGSFAWDLSTGTWKSSEILDQIFGIDEKYIRSLEGLANIVHPDWQKTMDEYVNNEVIGKLQKFDIEYQIIKQNNSQERWVHGLAELELDSDNQPIRLVGTISDITERKQAEEKLNDSYVLLRIAEEKAQLGGWSVNLAENLCYWSDGVATIHEMPPGYSPSVEVGINFYAPEWRDRMTKIFTDCAQEGIPYDEEMEIITPSGKRIWVNTIGEAVRDDKGKIVKVHGAFQDISERKRYEESLHETNEYLENLFNYANAPIIVWDADFRITRFNNAFEVLSGYTSGEVIGKKVDFLFPENKIDSLHEEFSKIASGARWESVEIEILRKDGEIRIVLWNSANILDQTESEIIATIAQGNDITDRKKIEEDLRKHSGRLQNLHMIDQAILQAIESPETVVQTAIHHIRELLDCQRVSVGIFDLEKKEVLVYAADVDGKTIVQVGKVLTEEMYGVIDELRHSKMEIVQDMSMVVSPSLVNLILQAEGVQSSINVALVSELEMYGVLNVGWEKSKTISAEETEIAGEVANQITIAIEKARLLKETKGYASELEHRVKQRTEQLEAANKELEAFSYSVSHDLRSPLRHISGFSEMLSKDLQKQLSDKNLHYLDVINSSAKKMGNLIDDLLSFSRAGRTEMKKTRFNMNMVVEDALVQVRLTIKDRKIDWNITTLPMIFCDYNLLRLVWVNLIDNAVKYTRTRKKTVIKIDCKEESEEYVFSIGDNGVGFDMQYANKLFDVFQRLHSSSEFEGTGIGLANVRRIILKHGGRTWAEAKLNKGATFYFTLPKNKENNLWMI